MPWPLNGIWLPPCRLSCENGRTAGAVLHLDRFFLGLCNGSTSPLKVFEYRTIIDRFMRSGGVQRSRVRRVPHEQSRIQAAVVGGQMGRNGNRKTHAASGAAAVARSPFAASGAASVGGCSAPTADMSMESPRCGAVFEALALPPRAPARR